MKPGHVVFLLVSATIICVALLEFIQNRTTDAPQAPTEALKPPQSSSVGAESSSSSEPKPSQNPDLAQNLTDERADALADEAASGTDEALNARFAPAEFRLGAEYEIPGNVSCVPKDESVARDWLRRSALDGSAKAAIFLADSYVEFKPTDFEEAKRWLARAEQLGIDSDDIATACGMALYYDLTGGTAEAEQWQAKCRTPASQRGEQGEQNDETTK